MKRYQVELEDLHDNFIPIALTMEDAKKCYHEGLCDEDVHEVCQQEYVKEQIKGHSIYDFASVLDNYGFYYDVVDSVEELFEDCVWLAAETILDEDGKYAKVIED